MSEWKPIRTAPKDGTEILARRDNGCAFEHVVVWWSPSDPEYPWRSEASAYPADRLDDWHPIPSSVANPTPVLDALKRATEA